MSEQDRPFDIRARNRLATQTDDWTLNSAETTFFKRVLGITQSSVPKLASGRISMDRLGSWICYRRVVSQDAETLNGVRNGNLGDTPNVVSKTLAFYPETAGTTLTAETVSGLPLIPGLEINLTENGLPMLVIRPGEKGAMHRILEKPKGGYRDWISADDKSTQRVTTNTSVVVGEGPGARPNLAIVLQSAGDPRTYRQQQ